MPIVRYSIQRIYKWPRAELLEAVVQLQAENDELKAKIKHLEQVIEYEKTLPKRRPYD